jgi:transcriptional regulator with XRE-family HTH domain
MNHANAFKGERLKKIRLLHGYSQRELAFHIGFLSVGGSIAKWELNRERPNDEKESRLCEFFKVEKDYFRK